MKKLCCVLLAILMLGLGGCANNKKTDDVYMTVAGINIPKESYDFIRAALKEQKVEDDKLDEQTKIELESMYNIIAIGRKMKIEIDGTSATQVATQMKNQSVPNQLADDYSEAQEFSKKLSELAKEEKAKKDPSLIEEVKKNKMRAKHVLVLTQDVDEDKIPEKKVLAEEILEKAKSGENFDVLIKDYNEDPGMTSNPDGYVFGTGEMVPEFEEGVKNTPVGEFSLVKTNYGYHIIQPLEIDDETAAKNVELTSDEFEGYIQNKLKELKIEKSDDLKKVN